MDLWAGCISAELLFNCLNLYSFRTQRVTLCLEYRHHRHSSTIV